MSNTESSIQIVVRMNADQVKDYRAKLRGHHDSCKGQEDIDNYKSNRLIEEILFQMCEYRFCNMIVDTKHYYNDRVVEKVIHALNGNGFIAVRKDEDSKMICVRVKE